MGRDWRRDGAEGKGGAGKGTTHRRRIEYIRLNFDEAPFERNGEKEIRATLWSASKRQIYAPATTGALSCSFLFVIEQASKATLR